VAFGGGDLADGGQQQAQRQVGNLFRQHAGRVGGDQAARGDGGDIEVIVSHAKAADDLQIGQMVQEVLIERAALARGDHAGDAGPQLSQKILPVGRFPQAMQGKAPFQPLLDRGRGR
jgi:hypothetical protein